MTCIGLRGEEKGREIGNNERKDAFIAGKP